MIDIIKLLRFIKTLDSKKFNEINISKSQLYEFKKSPNLLYKARLETVLKLNQYMIDSERIGDVTQNKTLNRSKNIQNKPIVGVDIGQKNILAASNSTLSQTFKSSTPHLTQLTKRYDEERLSAKNQMQSTQVKNMLKNKYINQIVSDINYNVNLMIKQFDSRSIFVIGQLHTSHMDPYHPLTIIEELIMKQLHNKLSGQARIEFISEERSSITCPKCHYSDRSNRTIHNEFKCGKCDFIYHDNDIIAAKNIATSYLNQL